MDFSAFVRSSLASGDTPEQVAYALIKEHRLLPISAIKALRSGGHMSSEEAAELIKRNLSPAQWAAAKRLWEMIGSGESTVDNER